MRARLILPGLLAAAALTLVGCGTQNTASSGSAEEKSRTTAPGSSAAAQEGAGAAVAPKALRFTGTTVDGRPFDAATLAGKPTVLWFWAPWCAKCRREAPYVADAQAETEAKVTFVGVAGAASVDDMREFVEDYEVGGFTHLNDADGSIWQRFGVSYQPAYAFIDSSGDIEVVRGELGRDEIEDRVADLTAN